jgi:hypothetical protein
VAARQSVPVIGALCSTADHDDRPAKEERKQSQDFSSIPDSERIILRSAPRPRRWTVSVGYRFQPSSRHFVGTVEQKQREAAGNQIQNTYHLLDISVDRQLTRRWSVNASLPLLFVNRNQLYAPRGEYKVYGQGDATVGAGYWLFRSPTESGGNVQIGASLKLPTGIYNSMQTAIDASGREILATADQSIQAGDGRLGFALSMQAFRPVGLGFMAYANGIYLFTPADTNGVSTFRRGRGEEIMSVADQYLFRGGVARAVPHVRGLTVTFGGRIEGVPVRDALGKSNGFRRPGYAISGDPGFLYGRGDYIFSCSVPWAIERNRRRSVPDIANGRHGDAAFADFALVVGVSRRF